MTQQHIGILHPGEMGVSVAASAQNSGNTVYWIPAGRSAKTRERAEKVGLQPADSLAALCETCGVILTVCPPAFAESVAQEVVACGFSGLYLDANAIAPQRAERIDQIMANAGAMFVDGGIIGGPAWQPGRTWLYLSGTTAQQAADCFCAGPLETAIIGDEIGKASALKMCFAAYTKGTTALLAAIVAAAESLGVRDVLELQWSRDSSAFSEETAQRVRRVTAKAWRFTGEMDEIAATLNAAGLPDGFHRAAAEIYSRMAEFKDAPETPALADVLTALLRI